MDVIDIIRSAAWYAGVLRQVDMNLEEDEEEYKEVADDLLRAYNNVENELALNYLPLVEKEEFETEWGELVFNEFSYRVIHILNVYNEQGEKLKFELRPGCVLTKPGKIWVEYTYTPYEKDFYDTTEHQMFVAAPLFVFGMLAEFYLARGEFEEAAVWDKKYKEAISSSYQMQKGKRMPCRGWS